MLAYPSSQPASLMPDSPYYSIDICQCLPTKNHIFIRVFPTIKNTDFPHKKYRLSRQTNGESCVTVNMSVLLEAFPLDSHRRGKPRIHIQKNIGEGSMVTYGFAYKPSSGVSNGVSKPSPWLTAYKAREVMPMLDQSRLFHLRAVKRSVSCT